MIVDIEQPTLEGGRPRPIRGWLILIAVVLILTLVRLGWGLLHAIDALDAAGWNPAVVRDGIDDGTVFMISVTMTAVPFAWWLTATVLFLLYAALLALFALGDRDIFYLRDERQVFDDAHVRIERRRFGKIPGAALRLDRLIEHVEARDDGFAVRGRHIARQNPHRRRLAGAVRAEEAENLAALDSEADVVDRRHFAVAFREVLNLDHV